jgi:hypothetical protein
MSTAQRPEETRSGTLERRLATPQQVAAERVWDRATPIAPALQATARALSRRLGRP